MTILNDEQDIVAIQRDCFRIAREHGWHDNERTIGDICALIHSEVSEALEAHRVAGPLSRWYSGDKPEGFMTELADVVIRVLDTAEKLESQGAPRFIDVLLEKMKYNETRPYRHGGKAL